jgi:hypothetical protein
MAPTHLTLSDDKLLAEYVALEPFKGVLQQRIAVGPDMLAMLLRDGRIAAASAGAHFAIGGLWRTLQEAVAGKHAIRLLIADLKPFQLSMAATSLTRDNVPVACEFTIELQVDPEKPSNVLGLMGAHGALTKASVLERLTPSLCERVLNAAVRQVDALELRGNTGMQDKVQADTMKEVERLASDLGLIARSVSVAWGSNEEERAAILKREKDREQERLDHEFEILNRSVKRETESTVIRLEADLSIEKANISNADDLRRLMLSNELNFADARKTDARLQEVKGLEHDLHLNRTKRLDGLKAQLETEQHAIEITRAGGLKRDVEMDVAKREHSHALEVARIRAEIQSIEGPSRESERRRQLALDRLEKLQEQEIAESQIRTTRGRHAAEIEAAGGHIDLDIKAKNAEHARRMEEARQAHQTELDKIKLLKDVSPEQIAAIGGILGGPKPAASGTPVGVRSWEPSGATSQRDPSPAGPPGREDVETPHNTPAVQDRRSRTVQMLIGGIAVAVLIVAAAILVPKTRSGAAPLVEPSASSSPTATTPAAPSVAKAEGGTKIPESGLGTQRADVPTSTSSGIRAGTPAPANPTDVAHSPNFLNAAAVASHRPLVLVVNAERASQGQFTSIVARTISGNGGAFLPDFLAKGFASAYAGDSRGLTAVEGIAGVPLILLAVSESETEANAIEGLRRARLVMSVRTYRPSAGFATDMLQVEGIGAGFSDSEALNNAAQRAADELKKLVRLE